MSERNTLVLLEEPEGLLRGHGGLRRSRRFSWWLNGVKIDSIAENMDPDYLGGASFERAVAGMTLRYEMATRVKIMRARMKK